MGQLERRKCDACGRSMMVNPVRSHPWLCSRKDCKRKYHPISMDGMQRIDQYGK